MSKDYSLAISKRVIVPLVLFVLLSGMMVYFGLSWAQTNLSGTPQVHEQATVTPRPARALNADLVEKLVNDERIKLGLPALAHSDTLRASACAKLDHMVKYDYWSHNAPDGTEPWHYFEVVGYAYAKAGENLAYGQTSEAGMVSDWMNSPAHRDNIVGQYAESGLCTRLEKYQGWAQSISVHHFGTRL